MRLAARNLPHSGQPLSPVSMCSMGNPRSDSYCVRSYVYHACHAFAPAFVFCGFAARSFSSCLRFAARTLPRPCRSPPPSWQPLSPIPVCCVDPILRCAEPYPVRHASRLPFCFAGSRRGAFLRRFVPVLLLHPVRISLPRNARCSMLDPRYGSYRTRPYRLVPRMTRARACLAFLFCGFAARSFPSCLRLAARTLSRPHRSPSHF